MTQTIPAEKGRRAVGRAPWPLLVLALALSVWIAAAAGADVAEIRSLDQPTSLAGRWRFAIGDDPGWAQPGFDDSAWAVLEVPKPWGRQGYPAYEGIAWYRLHVRVSPELMAARTAGSELRLAATLGKVESAYELYAGGRRLGGVGALPPAPRQDYDRHSTYAIPPTAVDGEGRLLLAVRVWRASGPDRFSGGLSEGPFLFGRLEDLVHDGLVEELPELVLACLYALVGVYHLLLYKRRPELSEYLWFGTLALDIAVYTVLRTQWKYALTDHYLLLKKIEYLCLYPTPALGIGCIWRLLATPVGRWRWLQLAFASLTVLVLAGPGLDWNRLTLPWWEAVAILWIVATLGVIAAAVHRGNPEARTLAAGISVLLASGLSDILVDLSLIRVPRTLPFGFAAFVLSMAVSLANRFTRTYGELDDLRRTLEQRVEHRTHELSEANAHLAQAHTRAEAANQAKSVFLTNMSHELRTPLNAVLGFAQLMARRKGRDAEDLDQLAIIGRSGEHLLGLINDVLSLSKIEAGRATLSPSTFEPLPMLKALVGMLRMKAESKGLTLLLEDDGSFPATVAGDEGKLRQILLNLLSNAVKFTSRGRVVLRARWADGQGSFEVEDTGPGMSPPETERLFQPFVQTETGRKSAEGTGLGLTISRSFARLMGGDLSVRSEPGKWTVFTATMSLPAGQGATLHAEGDRRRVIGLAPGQAQPRILAVDDVLENRLWLSTLLSGVGFRVEVAVNGQEAIELWEKERPQLIFMDVRMPVMDGLTATQRIRAAEAARGEQQPVRIVVLSASVLEHERVEILRAGCDAFLEKPVREAVLFETLARFLELRFVHEQSAPSAPLRAEISVLTVERLTAVSAKHRERLRDALGGGDDEAALLVAEEIRAEDAELGEALLTAIRAYHFDQLLALMKKVSA